MRVPSRLVHIQKQWTKLLGQNHIACTMCRPQAVNIAADSTVESLTPFFSACGVAEAIRVIHKGKNDNTNNK